MILIILLHLGLFIDKLVEVAKRELGWEVDYEREAECTKKFKKLVEPYPEYLVPAVIGKFKDHKTTCMLNSKLCFIILCSHFGTFYLR